MKKLVLRVVKTGQPGCSTYYKGDIIENDKIKELLKEIVQPGAAIDH